MIENPRLMMAPSEIEKKQLKEAHYRKIAEMWIKSIYKEYETYGEVDEEGIDFYSGRLKEILCIDEEPVIHVSRDVVEIKTNDMLIRYEAGVIRAIPR